MLTKQKIVGAMSGNIIETALGFVTVMFVTRNYSQSDAGVYFLVLAIVSILNNLKEGFLQNGFVKYLLEHDFDRKVIGTGLAISLLGEILKIVIFSLVGYVYSQVWPFVYFYYFYTLSYSTYRFLIMLHRSRLDMKAIVRNNVSVLVVTLLGLSLLYFFKWPVHWVFALSGFAYMVVSFVWPSPDRKMLFSNFFTQFDRQLFRKMVDFGKYGFFKEVSGSVAHQAGIFISAYFLSLEATSLLGLANRYAILIAIPGASLAGMLYPILLTCGGDTQKLRSAATDNIGKIYALLIPIALFILVLSPLALLLLHGPAYLYSSVLLIFKVLASVLLIPLGSGYSSIMNTVNKPQEITKLMLISSLTNILLSVLFIYYFGILGAVLAPLLTELVGIYLMKVKLKRLLNFEIFDLTITIKNYWIYWLKKYKNHSWKKLKYQL